MERREPLGYIDYDNPSSHNWRMCRLIVRKGKGGGVFRGRYILIEDSAGKHKFLARVVSGPFYPPIDVPPSSAIRAELVRHNIPAEYYTACDLEILGEIDERKGIIESSFTRPKPYSPVYPLGGSEILWYLGLRPQGILLGHLVGYKKLRVSLDPWDPDLLPRNVGIFGTIGSGKTTTAQVLIEEASRAGWAVIVIDVEGEYLYMDHPNDDARMVEILRNEYGLEPRGLKDFSVYTPACMEPNRTDSRRFCIRFCELLREPHVLLEILEATEAQERYFEEVLERLGLQEAPSLPEFLALPEESSPAESLTLDYLIDHISRLAEDVHIPSFKRNSLLVLASKLIRLRRMMIVDVSSSGVKPLEINDLLRPGRVSVIDVSMASRTIRNVIIAWVIASVFRWKLRTRRKHPAVMIVIEEAHSFVHKEQADRMKATLEMLQRVSLRGRKRWISLVLISQMPSHIPTQIFELCNVRIIHTLRSEDNIRMLAHTTGGVTKQEWDLVPTLRTGEALIATPKTPHPLIVKVRPALTKKCVLQEELPEGIRREFLRE